MSVQVAEASRHILIYVCVLFAEQQLSDPHIGIGSVGTHEFRAGVASDPKWPKSGLRGGTVKRHTFSRHSLGPDYAVRM
jgi:hypothetical protein